jgi:hypothetical protein
MKRMTCPREDEIVRSIAAGRWPDGCDDELRAHAGACSLCADLVEVAAAITEDANTSTRDIDLPPAGIVFWRIQRRAREEAARTAVRTVALVQAATVAATALAILAVLGGISLFRQDWRASFMHVTSAIHTDAIQIFTSLVAQWNIPLLLAIATCLLLAPIAVYYAVTE